MTNEANARTKKFFNHVEDSGRCCWEGLRLMDAATKIVVPQIELSEQDELMKLFLSDLVQPIKLTRTHLPTHYQTKSIKVKRLHG